MRNLLFDLPLLRAQIANSPATKLKKTFVPVAAAVMIFAAHGPVSAKGRPSTLIVGAQVVDGTGGPSRMVSVRVEGGRIAEIGDLSAHAGETIVEADGKILAPGFIDTHSHHDHGIFENPDALTATSQGITTIIVGQDGGSELPVSKLFKQMKSTPVSVNIGSYVGHNTVRAAVLGDDFKREATPAEIRRMLVHVKRAMDAGAIGLSTGLEYDPGIYSSKAEVLTLAKAVARAGGRYISHIRSEDQFLWPALDEIVEIGRIAKMPVQVSHMKLAMVDWWGQADRYLGVLDRARASGIDISGDVYPYEYWQSTLTVMFPHRDFTNRASAEFALAHLAPAEGLLLSSFSPDPSLVGKTVAQVAKLRKIDDADALMQLIAESQVPGASESVIGTSMRADDVAKLIAWPNANISSDGALVDRHPRGAGSFTRILRQYVRDDHSLTIEQAVHKMTGAAAEHMGISDRGVLRPGAAADLVLFDPAVVADRATSDNPSALSVGVAFVWVNGDVVLRNGASTGAHPGRPILRSRAK
jgi:N-acyl-D-amino-acid deacylase